MKCKQVLLFLILLLCFRSIAQSDELLLGNGSTETLRSAINQLNGSGTITIEGQINMNLSLIVPVGITLKVKKGGGFKLQDGVALRIDGALKAGIYAIFNKSVRFTRNSVAEVKAEWFGRGDKAVNSALISAAEIPVRIAEDVEITDTISMASHQSLIIDQGIELLPSNDMIGASVISNKNPRDTDITVRGGIINGRGAESVAFDAVLFNGVSDSSISNLSCLNVHTTASADTGNIRLNDCDYVLIQNCNVTGTWKMGIFILNGSCNSIIGGSFYGTHDSAIGVVNSAGTTIDGLFVDNCGTSDGSNMSLNSERLLVINNTSINASGIRNGNGITLGHDGAPASYSVCTNNLIFNNASKGIFIQGKNTKNVVVSNNTIKSNGIASKGTNSGGVAVYSGSKGHLIYNNSINGNRLGVSLHRSSQNVSILNNQIVASRLFGIRIDGENIIVRDNYFFNRINVYEGKNSQNLVLESNMMQFE